MIASSTSVLRKVLIVVLIVLLMYFGKSLFMPLAIGGMLAALFLPLCRWMEKRKIRRALAAFICLLILVIGISGVILMVTWEISNLRDDVPAIKERAVSAGENVQKFLMDKLGITVEKQTQMLKNEQPSVSGIMQKVGGSLTYILTNFALILIYVPFLLYHRTHLYRFLLKIASNSDHQKTESAFHGAIMVSQQYLVGLSKVIVCLWIMYGIGFSLLGLKNALLFAIICGLLEIVPYIGNITGTALTVLVAAAQGAGLPLLAGIVITYAVVQLIQGWLLEPLIVGHQVKINPLFTIIALVVGELIWGIPGVFLAIPLTAIFKTFCEHVESLKPYAFLIGELEKQP